MNCFRRHLLRARLTAMVCVLALVAGAVLDAHAATGAHDGTDAAHAAHAHAGDSVGCPAADDPTDLPAEAPGPGCCHAAVCVVADLPFGDGFAVARVVVRAGAGRPSDEALRRGLRPLPPLRPPRPTDFS